MGSAVSPGILCGAARHRGTGVCNDLQASGYNAGIVAGICPYFGIGTRVYKTIRYRMNFIRFVKKERVYWLMSDQESLMERTDQSDLYPPFDRFRC